MLSVYVALDPQSLVPYGVWDSEALFVYLKVYLLEASSGVFNVFRLFELSKYPLYKKNVVPFGVLFVYGASDPQSLVP